MAWYNKYRPQNFDEVFGQELVKSVLQNAIKKNLIKNAYLLSGPKGVGKTTIARIFAGQINQTNDNPEASIDIIEMDAASNTGIDDVRQLINSANNPPINGKFKIYIIDEVHMLSKQAMNALLKIIEEPPQYLVFLFATTNPEKIIPTVLSRLTKLNLSSHTHGDITKKLSSIAEKEKLSIDNESLGVIATRSGGSQRDAINLLETIGSYGLDKYDKLITANLLGLLPEDLLSQSLEFFVGSDNDLASLVSEIEKSGIDPDSFLSQLFDYSLDKAFEEPKYNKIVEVLAKIISYKLPLTSIKSAIAIIYSHLSTESSVERSVNRGPKIEEQINKPTNIYGELPTSNNKVEVNEPVSEKKIESDSSNIESESQNTEQEKKPEIKNFAGDSDLNEHFNHLRNSSDCPPMLKMILADMLVDSFDGGVLRVCVSNGIIENQVKSNKNSAWIKQRVTDNTGSEVREIIVMIQKKDIASPKPLPQEPQDFGFVESYNDVKDIEPEKAPIESTPTKPAKKKKLPKIFYKIYKQLPAEIPDSKIPVYSNDIPVPEKSDDWSSEIENEFEFE